MSETKKITLLPGDGIGPEVTTAARRVLEAVAGGRPLEITEAHIGGIAIDETGDPLPAATLAACKSADAIFLGAVGGPKWSDPSAKVRPEQGLLRMRKELGVFANLRPVRVHPALAESSPLRPEKLAGVDMMIVRELTGGIYFGSPRTRSGEGAEETALDTLVYSRFEIERVVELACTIALGRRKKVTSVDKANVLESMRLWRSVATEVVGKHAELTLEHQLVDSCTMRLLTHAAELDVIVTGNMFGDIISDEAAALSGSLGMLPSASLGSDGPGVYEPIHGSAPDIAGKGVANPLGAIGSMAMLCRHSLGWTAEADAIEVAIDAAISGGARTGDLGGDMGTEAMTAVVLKHLG